MNATINILAQAAKTESGSGSLFGSPIVMMVLMFVVFWVILIRPQQKQRKALAAKQAALKKGDKVVTIGGIHASVNEKTVSLKVAEGTVIKYDKSAIATVTPSASKSDDDQSDEVSKG